MWHSYVTWLFHSDVTLLIQNWHLYVTCLLHTGLWFSPGTTRSYETRLIYTWHGSPIWDLKENTFYGSLCQTLILSRQYSFIRDSPHIYVTWLTHMRLEREHILWISLPVFDSLQALLVHTRLASYIRDMAHPYETWKRTHSMDLFASLSPIWDLKENTFYGSLCQSFTHMRLDCPLQALACDIDRTYKLQLAGYHVEWTVISSLSFSLSLSLSLSSFSSSLFLFFSLYPPFFSLSLSLSVFLNLFLSVWMCREYMYRSKHLYICIYIYVYINM